MFDSKRKSQCLYQQTGCTECILLKKQQKEVLTGGGAERLFQEIL